MCVMVGGDLFLATISSMDGLLNGDFCLLTRLSGLEEIPLLLPLPEGVVGVVE